MLASEKNMCVWLSNENWKQERDEDRTRTSRRTDYFSLAIPTSIFFFHFEDEEEEQEEEKRLNRSDFLSACQGCFSTWESNEFRGKENLVRTWTMRINGNPLFDQVVSHSRKFFLLSLSLSRTLLLVQSENKHHIKQFQRVYFALSPIKSKRFFSFSLPLCFSLSLSLSCALDALSFNSTLV